MNLPTFARSSDVEIRKSDESAVMNVADDRLIHGYPIVFNSLSRDLGGFRERILPQAVNRSLTSDVMALVDHDSAKVLGRTRAGTLTMRKDSRGLKVTIEPDLEISYARDIVRAVARGDITGMSFGFRVLEQDPHREEGRLVRDISDLELLEVSIVTFPSYEAADVSIAKRALALYEAQTVQGYDWRSKWHDIQKVVIG